MTRSNAIRRAARNAWALTLGDGVEKGDPTPSTEVYAGHHRTLRRFEGTTNPSGEPVLLVPPLAVSIRCFDLRPSESLARHLVEGGRPTYVIDYGDITFADRRMGFEEWIDDILPTAIRRVSDEHDGAQVHLVAWSLGGTLSYLTLAAHPDLPVASLTALGTPCDYTKIPGTAVAAAVSKVAGDTIMNLPAAAMGGIPRHVVRLSYRAMALQRELTKPVFIARNLHRTESLAKMESIDRFMGEMPGYPGRLYLQLSSRLMYRNELATGIVHLTKGRAINLADLKPRVLLVGSRSDAIAPGPSVEPATKVLLGAESVRYADVDASHLGLVVDPDVWRLIADFHAPAGV